MRGTILSLLQYVFNEWCLVKAPLTLTFNSLLLQVNWFSTLSDPRPGETVMGFPRTVTYPVSHYAAQMVVL